MWLKEVEALKDGLHTVHLTSETKKVVRKASLKKKKVNLKHNTISEESVK
jgi:Cu/Ag efflux protein CusF